MRCYVLTVVVALCFASAAVAVKQARAEAAKQATPEAVKWFQDAKFGMFIHWGVYAVRGRGEWTMYHDKVDIAEYEKLPPKFNPVKYDPAAWVAMAKGAGMRYMTFTSKHHDGFAMFDSKLSKYDIVDDTPYGKDACKMLADECERQDMKLFFYYSHLDWHHPDYYPRGNSSRPNGRPDSGDWSKYKQYYMAQVDELCSGRYGKVAGIWFDGWWEQPKADWGLTECYNRIHTAQPDALVGNNHHHSPFPGEDFQMFEQDLPGQNTAGFNKAEISSKPLEMCLTMNNSWGYNSSDHKWKSADELIRLLVRASGLGCNLLLNVGPRPDGTLQPEAIERLAALGKFTKVNGEAIYGTRRGPYGPADWGVSTMKGDNTVFLHVLHVPASGAVVVDAPPRTVASAKLLGGETVKTKTEGGKLHVELPKAEKSVDTIVVIELAGS